MSAYPTTGVPPRAVSGLPPRAAPAVRGGSDGGEDGDAAVAGSGSRSRSSAVAAGTGGAAGGTKHSRVKWRAPCSFPDCAGPSRADASLICAGCRRVKYCARACQQSDWGRHREDCKGAARLDSCGVQTTDITPEAMLTQAALDGSPERVLALLLRGADFNARLSMENTPLHWACYSGWASATRVLAFWPGVALNARNLLGATPLQLAVESRDFMTVRALCEAPGVAVDEVEEYERTTPLHHAALNGRADVVRELLKAGASVTAVERHGATALHLAADNGDLATLRLLLAAPGVSLVAESSEGLTPLHVAARQGNAPAVRELLAAGAPVNAAPATGSFKGLTALYPARLNRHFDVVAVLLAAGGRD